MAIDVSLFGADLPAGTYTRGDRVPLSIVAGPANVRSGRGAAYLKRITSLLMLNQSGSKSLWRIEVRNSDWIDNAASIAGDALNSTALDRRSGAIQNGHNCPLTPNSTWDVTAVCLSTGTTTVANSLAALIEIDYPSVSAITEPDILQGYPTSITVTENINVNAPGTITSSQWDVFNVDIFKAGYQYALEKIETLAVSRAQSGFIAFSGAAGMGGLTRILPINNLTDNIRSLVEYATSLVKGPMDIKFMTFNNGGTTATTDTVDITMDYVKRKV